jgi:hypothetical protein
MFLANLIKNYAPRTYHELHAIKLERFTDAHRYGYLEGLHRSREVVNLIIDEMCKCDKKHKDCKNEVARVLINNAIDGEIEDAD